MERSSYTVSAEEIMEQTKRENKPLSLIADGTDIKKKQLWLNKNGQNQAADV